MRLGADRYFATSDDATFEELAGRFDLIINTVSAPLEMGLLLQRRSFAGSAIGSIRETQEMLDFCAEHGIAADIEVIDAEQINDAWERVLASDVRYRFVIDSSTV